LTPSVKNNQIMDFRLLIYFNTPLQEVEIHNQRR
jgi:hypothetical protein